jgi:gamma-glutamyltranspeptidase/glutathione hydrolase
VAEAIVEVTRGLGGYLTLEDLKQHGQRGSEFTQAVPICLDKNMMAHGRTTSGVASHIQLWEHPPNGQGIVAQMALGILQELDKQGQTPKFQPNDHNSPQLVFSTAHFELSGSGA